MNSVLMRLLGWLQKQCKHPSETVTFDITEGGNDLAVHWCRICGAYRFGDAVMWHPARADWWVKHE